MVDCADGNFNIKKIEVGPYSNNVYIISSKDTGKGVIIDAAADPEKILKEAHGLKIEYILQTHCHGDHIGALSRLRVVTGAPLGMHKNESAFFSIKADFFIDDGDEVSFGDLQLKAIHTPGHTPGGLCFLIGDHLISGDTLFPGGPGKTASPKDFMTIERTIKEKLYALPDHVIVYPGHGANTTIEKSKKEYAEFLKKPRRPDLCGDVLW